MLEVESVITRSDYLDLQNIHKLDNAVKIYWCVKFVCQKAGKFVKLIWKIKVLAYSGSSSLLILERFS